MKGLHKMKITVEYIPSEETPEYGYVSYNQGVLTYGRQFGLPEIEDDLFDIDDDFLGGDGYDD